VRQCASADGLGDKSRIIQGMDHFPQSRHPEAVVPSKKLPGRRLVGGHPRTNVHRTNVTAMEKRAIALLFRRESRYRLRRLAKLSHSMHESEFGWGPDSSGEGKVSGRSECAP
jgi:hypothetical protein